MNLSDRFEDIMRSPLGRGNNRSWKFNRWWCGSTRSPLRSGGRRSRKSCRRDTETDAETCNTWPCHLEIWYWSLLQFWSFWIGWFLLRGLIPFQIRPRGQGGGRLLISSKSMLWCRWKRFFGDFRRKEKVRSLLYKRRKHPWSPKREIADNTLAERECGLLNKDSIAPAVCTPNSLKWGFKFKYEGGDLWNL